MGLILHVSNLGVAHAESRGGLEVGLFELLALHMLSLHGTVFGLHLLGF